MKRRFLLCTLASLLVANATTTAAEDKDWTADLSQDGTAITVKPTKGLSETEASTVPLAGITLIITCKTSLDCSLVTAELEISGASTPLTSSPSGTTATIEIPPLKKSGMLHILYKKDRKRGFPLKGSPVGEPDAPVGDVPLKELLICNYSKKENSDREDVKKSDEGSANYSRSTNEALFEVTALGTIISAPQESIDENDLVRVRVAVHPQLKPFLKVRRTSAIRVGGVLNIVGAEVTVPVLTDLKRQAAGEMVSCEVLEVALRDFAPGEGVVKISAQIGEKEVDLGSFSFLVSRLYHGMFSLGPISTKNVDHSFKLISRGNQKIIADDFEGNSDTLYAVMYTPFIWGPRDLEKSDRPFSLEGLAHLNPMIGVVTNGVSENALAGVSFDWAGFVFTYGRHWRRVTVLSSSSKLEVGDPFTGATSDLPTSRKWEADRFYGVSIDLRAAVQLLKSAFGSNGKK